MQFYSLILTSVYWVLNILASDPALCGGEASHNTISLKGLIKQRFTFHYCVRFKPHIPYCTYLCHTTHLSSTPYLSPPSTAASSSQSYVFIRGGYCVIFLSLPQRNTHCSSISTKRTSNHVSAGITNNNNNKTVHCTLWKIRCLQRKCIMAPGQAKVLIMHL